MTHTETPRAIHLAAGQGTRLRPLTNDRPKPLVELGGQSLLERNIDTLTAAGVDDQLVVTGYMSERIEELGYDTVHNEIYDETEMVYSLFCAEDRFPADRDLLISYGDIIYDQSVVDAILDCTTPLCVVVDHNWKMLWDQRFEDPLSDAETLELDADGQILEIGSEPESSDDIEAQYIGLLKIRGDYIDKFARVYRELSNDGLNSGQMTHFIQHLIDTGWTVQSVPISGGWIEVDTIEDLMFYQDQIDSGTQFPHLAWCSR